MVDNTIVQENLKQGTSQDVWDAPTDPTEIEGFATDISVNHGDTVSFKINVNATSNPTFGQSVPYHIEIYRLGYYGGDGATLVTTINGLTGTNQPNPIVDPTTGEVDAGNWSVSAKWATPATAVSGVYMARIVRDDDGASNQIPFIVRNDGGTSDIVFQTSDSTWQAYNGWGGKNGQLGSNFYGGNAVHPPVSNDPGLGSQSRAFAVSYNRPLITTGPAAGQQDSLFGAEYAGISWLEQNGYNVSYIAGVDADRLGVNALLGHKVYLSVGHDEYWSGNQRANVTAARDAGVNLAFLSGNEVYWKTRYAASTVSTDGSPTDYRTLISYKETWDYMNAATPASSYLNNDPSDQWTGTWIDARFVKSTDANGKLDAIGGGNPQNSLTGQLFAADGNGQVGPGITVTAAESKLRIWRDTSVETNGGVTGLAPGILGYEFDASPYDATTPAGLIHLSDTTVNWNTVLVDQGNSTPPGVVTHNLSLYKAPSGALVFGAGTVFWTWGLSNQHDSQPYGATIANPVIQQATVNVLADMGVQPQTIQAGLVLTSSSTDVTPPTSTITIDGSPASVSSGQVVTIRGTAIDNNNSTDPAAYGQVAAVQVSTDDGVTWGVATQTPSGTTPGAVDWTYQWSATGAGNHIILVQPVDDSLNTQSDISKLASASVVVDAGTPQGGGLSLFGPTDGPSGGTGAAVFTDVNNAELGVRFESDVAGTITQIKYFRGAADTDYSDVRQGHLWSADGSLLATVTFDSVPGHSGWQTATLSTPVVIQANTVYVASYHSAHNYVSTHDFFDSTYTAPSGHLIAPNGADGVFDNGSGATFPTQSFAGSNYWIDFSFTPANGPNSPLRFTSASNPTVLADQTMVTTVTVADPASSALTYSIVPASGGGGADGAQFQIDPATGVLTFTTPPEFESPTDAGHDSVYNVTVAALDGAGNLQEQTLGVAVTPTAETPPVATTPVFDGRAVQGEYIFGGTPTTEAPWDGSIQTTTVGPGVEFQNLPNASSDVGNGADGLATVDIGSSTIRLTFPLDPAVWPDGLGFAPASSYPYNGVLISFPGGLPSNLTGFSIVDQKGFNNNLTSSDVTMVPGGVFVSVAGNGRQTDADPNTPGIQPTYVVLQANYSATAEPLITSAGGGNAASVSIADNTSLVSLVTATEAGFAGAFTYAIVPAGGGGGADSRLFKIINGDELRFKTEPDFNNLPASASGAPDLYQVTVEASDGSGGFAQQTLTINVTAAAQHPDSTKSFLVASPLTVTADGLQVTTLTVTLVDAGGNAVAGQEVILSGSGANNKFGQVMGVTADDGVFTTTLASTTAQAETITAIDGTAQELALVTFIAGTPSATTSTITASPTTITADGLSTTTLTVTVRDAFGNPVCGQNVLLGGAGSNNNFGATSGATDVNGMFTTILASSKAQTETITANEGGVLEQTPVTFLGGAPSAATSTLVASPGPVTADGVQTVALTVTVLDVSGNIVAHRAVTLSGDGSNNKFGVDNQTTITGATDANGQFTTTLSSTLARTEAITATEGTTKESAQVTFTPGAPSAVTSSLVAGPGAVTADGQYGAQLTVTARDAYDNPVSGQTVTLSGAGANFGVATGQTDANGMFTTTVSANLTLTQSITATINGTVDETLPVTSTAPPKVALVLGSSAVNEGAAVTITITSTPANTDTTTTYALAGVPTDATLSDAAGALTVTGGQITLTESQLVGLTLTAGETNASLSVTATGGAGTATSPTNILTVTPVAETPSVFLTLGSTTVNEGAAVGITITSTQADGEGTSTYTLTGVPSDATLSDTAGALTVIGGQVTLTEGQLASLTLTAGETNASLSVTATSSEGASTSAPSAPATAALTVNAAGRSYALTNGKDTIAGGSGDDTVIAPAGTLTTTDTIDTGGGFDTLALTGVGTFNLGAPATLANLEAITVSETQSTTGAAASKKQVIVLRDGLNATVTVAPASPNSLSGITITGAANAATINLGGGTDVVNLGSVNEKVNGGAGPDAINATAATAGALIKGGTGTMTLNVTNGGAIALNPADSGLTAINLALATHAYSVDVGSQPNLIITDKNTTADTITGVAASDIVNAGAASVTVMATAANAGVKIVGGTGSNVLELITGGTAVLNAATTKVQVKLDQPTNLTLSPGVTMATGSVGDDTFNVTATSLRAGLSLDGKGGINTLAIAGGGTVVMRANITNVQNVALAAGTNFTANSLDLTITGSKATDTIQAGSGAETITGAGGADILIAGSGADTFKDTGVNLAHDTIKSFTVGDTIDITDLQPSAGTVTARWVAGILKVTQGATKVMIKLPGTLTGTFSAVSDGGSGTAIHYTPPAPAQSHAAILAQAMAGFASTGSPAIHELPISVRSSWNGVMIAQP
jgi:hypothetical protein